MPLMPSSMLPLGTYAPDFCLPDTRSGHQVCLNELTLKKGLLVMFICNHCPFVKHVEDKLIQLGREYPAKGITFIAISSNDVVEHPVDGPELMAQKGYPFPYLYDESQDIAKAYQAACTPDFFLFDGNKTLVYRGQLDASKPGNGIAVSGADLTAAMDALIAGNPINPDQKPSMGCNIKWKAG